MRRTAFSITRSVISSVSRQKENLMRFCTAINCMDGRTQLPVIRYLQQRFEAEHVDAITEPGPNLILSQQKNRGAIQSILERLEISIGRHKSLGVAVVGHHDCAGNPAPKDEQIKHVQKAVQFLQKQYEDVEIIGLWVNDKWEVREVAQSEAGG